MNIVKYRGKRFLDCPDVDVHIEANKQLNYSIQHFLFSAMTSGEYSGVNDIQQEFDDICIENAGDILENIRTIFDFEQDEKE